MNISLPEIVQFQQTCTHDTAWSDHYGALYVAAAYCDIELPTTKFRHVWQHGCEGPWSPSPEMMVCNTPDPKNKKLFVARKEEELALHAAGYEKAKAIGLPMVYVDSPRLERTPKSLLIMPQHTLVGMKRGSKEDRMRYIEMLQPFIADFDVVAACVSPSCIINGYFVDEFRQIGVDVIPGTLTSDLNALLRMRCLMEQFDSMTTNGWGTHLAYSLSFGMKVSVYGQHSEIEDDELLKDITWASFDEETRHSIRRKAIEGERDFIAPFSANPSEGISNPSLGAWLIGVENKQSPEDLKNNFDWN